jgi:putative transcriptional regulator
MNPAQKRYARRVFVAMACYMVTLSIALHYVGKGHLAGPLAYLLALLPAFSVSGVFWAVGRRLVEETDEYQRMLLVRQGLSRSGRPRPPCRRLFHRHPVVRRAWRRQSCQLADARHDRGGMSMNNRLKVLRATRDWSQSDLADRLEVSRQSVNAIETGKYDPSLPLAFRIAELFDLPIEAIFHSPSKESAK